MTQVNPVSTATALAITVGVGYTLCTFVFWLWPEAAVNFMNALFHGLDFRKLQVRTSPFSFGSFISALVGLIIWAFVVGYIYGWVVSRFDNGR